MEPLSTYDKFNELSLPFCEYHGDQFDNRDALGLRLTFLMVEKGSGIIQINDTAASYIAPCAFCLNETEHCRITKEQNSEIRAVVFHPSIVNSYINLENIRDWNEEVPLTVNQDKQMFKFFYFREDNFIGKFNFGPLTVKKFLAQFEELHKQVVEQNTDLAYHSRSYIMAFLFLLDNLYEANLFENKSCHEMLQEDFYPILMYLYQNYDKKITVQEITKEFHINRTTLAQMFRKNLGDTFLTCLNRLRVTMAATMLRDTILPVNEIMFRVGFTDQVHFLRTFKKYVDMSPTMYREKYNWIL